MEEQASAKNVRGLNVPRSLNEPMSATVYTSPDGVHIQLRPVHGNTFEVAKKQNMLFLGTPEVEFGSFPGLRAKIKGRLRSLAIWPAKINPLLSMLTTKSAPKFFVILTNASHVFRNASGVSIKLVISLNSIPSIGKSLIFLICFLIFKGSLTFIPTLWSQEALKRCHT